MDRSLTVFTPSDPEAPLCVQGDADAWYEVDEVANHRAAIRVCRNCDARVECLLWAVLHGETEGVWGGLGARGRSEWASDRRRRGLPFTVEAVYAEEDTQREAAA